MPTILELFKDPSKWQFGTNYKNSVKDDKNIIETIASKTSKIRRQTGVDLNNPLIYGTGAIRIANRTIQTTELQKEGTGGESGDGGLVGKGLSKFGKGNITSLSQGRDVLSDKLGLPSKLIPSKVISNEDYFGDGTGKEQDTMINLSAIKNDGAGKDFGKFLKQTGGGNPKTIGRQAVGGGIGIVKDNIRNQAFGAPMTLNEATGNSNFESTYSSTQKYSDILSKDGEQLRNIYTEGKGTTVKFANQSVDVINLDDVSPVNKISRKPHGNYKTRDVQSTGRKIYSYVDGVPKYRGKKSLFEKGFADLSRDGNVGDTVLSNGPSDNYTKDEMVDNQLIPFWVSGLNSSKPVFFRTTVSGITENVSPSWGSSKFIGNPYNFYTYSGVERSVSMNLSIYCNNPRELAKNWEKIEYLTSKTYPSINKDLSFVDAPFVKFRLGNIYNEKIAFIESLTYTVPDNSNWETEIDGLYLPKLIDVAIGFKFIEQEGSENVLYNYTRNQEAIKHLKDKQTNTEENKTTTTITTETTKIIGVNSDGTSQTEPPTKSSSNKNLNGGKSVDENNQDEVKKSSSSTDTVYVKEKYEFRIQHLKNRNEYVVSIRVPTETNNPMIDRQFYADDVYTIEELKEELTWTARNFGFTRRIKATGRQIFYPSNDVTFVFPGFEGMVLPE